MNQVLELGQAPQLGQNHSKGLSVDCVKGFRQIYEDGNEVQILSDALLLHLEYREDNVGGAAVGWNPHWASSRFSSEMLVMR